MTQHELELKANERQVGGKHYKKHPLEHWDTVALFNLDYFQGSAWKYILRWRDKNGLQDLEKARHYLDKYIEIETLRSQGILTKALLERAIRELEGISQEPAPVALYRAMAKGDDPVGDVLSGYPFKILDADDEGPLEVGDQPDDDVRFSHVPVDDEPTHFPHAHPDGCTHGDECPVHPYGGCP